MKPAPVGEHDLMWRCTRCGFMLRGPSEAAFDQLARHELPSLGFTLYGDESGEVFMLEKAL
jgi:hypothetical protein